MKLLPMMSRGVPFVHEGPEGCFLTMVPMQVWRSRRGATILRIGSNTFYFDPDGKFDGTEHKIGGPPEAIERLHKALDESGKNRGLAPDEPYFEPGSDGWEDEVRAWANARSEPMTEDNYVVAVKKRKPS